MQDGGMSGHQDRSTVGAGEQVLLGAGRGRHHFGGRVVLSGGPVCRARRGFVGVVDVRGECMRLESSSARLLSTPGTFYRPDSSATSGANLSATLAPKAK